MLRNGARRVTRLALCLAPAFAACDDDIVGPPTFCNPAHEISRLTMEPFNDIVFVQFPPTLDDTVSLNVQAFDRLGFPMEEFPVRFISSDSTVAVAYGLGTLLPLAPGTVEITAQACDEKATATIIVVPASPPPP